MLTCTSKVRSVNTTPPTVMRMQSESTTFLVWIRWILSEIGDKIIAVIFCLMVCFAGVCAAGAFFEDVAEPLLASADFGFNKNLKGP